MLDYYLKKPEGRSSIHPIVVLTLIPFWISPFIIGFVGLVLGGGEEWGVVHWFDNCTLPIAGVSLAIII